MDRLRDDTLVDIAKKKRAYPHEVASMVEELQLLRDIHDGKRAAKEYGSEYLTIPVPMQILADDAYISGVDLGYLKLEVPKLVRYGSWPMKRFVVYRVR